MVSQLEDDWPKAGTKKKPSKTAKVAGGIFKAGKADPSEVWQQSRRKRGHVREQYGYKYSRNWPLKGIGREGSLLSRASCRVSGRRNYQDSMTSAKLKGPSRASIAINFIYCIIPGSTMEEEDLWLLSSQSDNHTVYNVPGHYIIGLYSSMICSLHWVSIIIVQYLPAATCAHVFAPYSTALKSRHIVCSSSYHHSITEPLQLPGSTWNCYCSHRSCRAVPHQSNHR